MAVFNKPADINKVWAATGDVLAPSDTKISQGWVIEIPPRQYFNYIDKKQDQAIAHINQFGISVWDSATEYQAGKSYVQGSNGVVYLAKTTHTNINPTTDTNFVTWGIAFSSPADGSVVGVSKNLTASVPTAAATMTITADELVVSTALGGVPKKIVNFNKTINLATIGVGGMDTGTAPVSGFVGIYAIYNPVTGASALLGVNASNAIVPEVYGGANMPAGYTASALLTVLPTTTGGLIAISFVTGRRVFTQTVYIYGSNSIAANVAVSALAGTPRNAVALSGYLSQMSTQPGQMSFDVSGSGGIGMARFTASVLAGLVVTTPFVSIPFTTRGQITVSTSNATSGSPTFQIYTTGYDI